MTHANAEGSALGGYLAAAGTVAIWTGFILVSRLGGKSPLTPYDTLALRLIAASLVLLPFSFSLPADVWRDARLWLITLIGGLCYGVSVFAAFKFAPAAHGAILLPGMQPFMVPLAAWMLWGTRPSRERMSGLAGIGVGVVCVAMHELGAQDAWRSEMLVGDALLLLSSLSWAIYSVLAKRSGRDPWTLTRFLALSTALVFLPVYVLWLPKALDQASGAMMLLQGLYQGVGVNILAMLLFLRAVHRLGAERTGALVAGVPVLAGLAAAPVLGEPVSVWLLFGLLCVSGGAFVAARPRHSAVQGR